jgi:protein-S-isoprenylcysteine O-methyltransferase Ste14
VNLLFRILRSIVYVPAFIFFFGWIALRVRVYDPNIGLMPLWSRTPGIIFMILGGSLVLACVGIFILKGKGTPAVFDPPAEFVATGPYASVRNPMYIGGFVLLVGYGLYHYSFSIIILSVVLLFLFHLFVVFVEEPTLERKFGESYLVYKGRIHRWISGRKRS